MYLQFELDQVRYFFASRPLQGGGGAALEIRLPDAIYEAERREDFRYSPRESSITPRRVRLKSDRGELVASVTDWSRQGLGIELPAADVSSLSFPLEIRHIGGAQDGKIGFARLRHREALGEHTRLGLWVSSVQDGEPIEIERVGVGASGWRRIPIRDSRPLFRSTGTVGAVQIVEYPNDVGQPIRALVNTTTDYVGGTAVVIPPSWGTTKERTLGLAATLVETFERAGEPLAVIRFDGTHRRGESWIAPRYRRDGDEGLGFTFSQAVRDVLATFEYVERRDTFAASRVVLVTFSLGAIDGRRAVAVHDSGRLAGWVSVVGVPDLQSGMRQFSGGVDYVQGWQQGVRWGVQEILGVRADIDHTGRDALANDLVYLDDARRDLASIDVPITWFHGRHDAWIDPVRVEQLLSAGATSNRRFVELPCGHQMRSSRVAMQVFETVAAEVARISVGRDIPTSSPDVRAFARLEKAERDRLMSREVDLRSFWRDYLLGVRQGLGIELMTATRAYQTFMADQIRLLDAPSGGILLDLGAGTGDLAVNIARSVPPERALRTVALDFVGEALARSRKRLGGLPVGGLAKSDCAVAQLDLSSSGIHVPIKDSSVDGVVASLVLSYLAIPSNLLEEARRVLKPGGCLVVSTMRRDADISRLYVDGVAELPPDRVRAHFGDLSGAQVEIYQRSFLNNAARLMRLEEEGQFRFWEADEFERLVIEAGFENVELTFSFGEPAQAIILRANAPR